MNCDKNVDLVGFSYILGVYTYTRFDTMICRHSVLLGDSVLRTGLRSKIQYLTHIPAMTIIMLTNDIDTVTLLFKLLDANTRAGRSSTELIC